MSQVSIWAKIPAKPGMRDEMVKAMQAEIEHVTNNEPGTIYYILHEDPKDVLNYFDRRLTTPLTDGMVLAIEPMLSAGSKWVVDGGDGWLFKTADGSLSSHFEHTVVVTRGHAIVLTAV